MDIERHRSDGTARLRSLRDYRLAIEDEADRFALRVGGLLRQAKASHPATFVRWVDEELPFGIDTARRLMVIHQAYERLPESTLAGLPRPWQALYAIRKLPPERLARAVASGELTPTTTIRAARELASGEPGAFVGTDRARHHRADIAAGALMDCSPDDLHPAVLRALLLWLRGGGVRPLALDVAGVDAGAAGPGERR